MSDFIDDIINREGGSEATNDPSDSGGRTQYGISERSNPEAWADGKVTYEEAREIYERVYILAEHFEKIEDQSLFHQVVDFGVPHGPDTATRLLQQLVGVSADGSLGPSTVQAITNYPAGKLFGVDVPGRVLLNLAFRDARVLFDATIAKKIPKNQKYVLGWIKRAQEFK
jgi:lysozyme family protein